MSDQPLYLQLAERIARNTLNQKPVAEHLPQGAMAELQKLYLDVASTTLAAIRRAKTEAKKGMRWPVASVAVTDTAARLAE